jgi:hypothetical protein
MPVPLRERAPHRFDWWLRKLPYSPRRRPEITILIGSFAWFFFWFLLFTKTLPTISIAEVKEHLAHQQEHGH